MVKHAEARVARWVGQHKHLSATIIVGGFSFIGLVISGPPADEAHLY
jgi:hypothetical protein